MSWKTISVRHKAHSFYSMDSESASVCEFNLSHKQRRQKKKAIHLPPDSTVLVQKVSSLSPSTGVCDVAKTEVVLRTVITLTHLSFISQGVSRISPAYLEEVWSMSFLEDLIPEMDVLFLSSVWNWGMPYQLTKLDALNQQSTNHS